MLSLFCFVGRAKTGTNLHGMKSHIALFENQTVQNEWGSLPVLGAFLHSSHGLNHWNATKSATRGAIDILTSNLHISASANQGKMFKTKWTRDKESWLWHYGSLWEGLLRGRRIRICNCFSFHPPQMRTSLLRLHFALFGTFACCVAESHVDVWKGSRDTCSPHMPFDQSVLQDWTSCSWCRANQWSPTEHLLSKHPVCYYHMSRGLRPAKRISGLWARRPVHSKNLLLSSYHTTWSNCSVFTLQVMWTKAYLCNKDKPPFPCKNRLYFEGFFTCIAQTLSMIAVLGNKHYFVFQKKGHSPG